MKTILQVEDTETDVLFLKLAARHVRPQPRIVTVSDGAEAIAYLTGDWSFSDREKFPLPDLVFLDMNLPNVGGLEVLTWVRAQHQFTHLPVVMLTSFEDESAAELALQIGANAYVIKPFSLNDLTRIVQSVLAWQFPEAVTALGQARHRSEAGEPQAVKAGRVAGQRRNLLEFLPNGAGG